MTLLSISVTIYNELRSYVCSYVCSYKTNYIEIGSYVCSNLFHIRKNMSQIIQSFTTWLSAIAPCQRGFLYLDQINEFPTITYTVSERALSHIGADTRYNILSISLRAYVRGEDPQALCDNLIQSLDERISLFEAYDLGVQDARVIETSSDEGLMAPYGVVDMKLQILYL